MIRELESQEAMAIWGGEHEIGDCAIGPATYPLPQCPPYGTSGGVPAIGMPGVSAPPPGSNTSVSPSNPNPCSDNNWATPCIPVSGNLYSPPVAPTPPRHTIIRPR